jgi:hypothetical protein
MCLRGGVAHRCSRVEISEHVMGVHGLYIHALQNTAIVRYELGGASYGGVVLEGMDLY